MSTPLTNDLKKKINGKIKQHLAAARFNQRWNCASNIISIVLGGITGLLGTIYASPNHSVYVMMAVVHWMLALLTSINHVFNFSARHIKHYDCYRQYSNLKEELNLTLLDPENNNISKVEHDFSDINLQEPSFSNCFLSCCCCKKNQLNV